MQALQEGEGEATGSLYGTCTEGGAVLLLLWLLLSSRLGCSCGWQALALLLLLPSRHDALRIARMVGRRKQAHGRAVGLCSVCRARYRYLEGWTCCRRRSAGHSSASPARTNALFTLARRVADGGRGGGWHGPRSAVQGSGSGRPVAAAQ